MEISKVPAGGTGPLAAPARGLALDLDAAGDAGKPLFLRIARAVTHAILRGRLAPGARLPGTRTLAAELSVHRNTVLAAYQELEAEGWIESSPARGTFVSSALPEQDRLLLPPGPHLPVRPGFAFAATPARGRAEPSSRAPLALDAGVPEVRPAPLALDAGVPDVRLAPTQALARAYRRALRRRGAIVLGYGSPAGHPRLRAALAALIARERGLATSAGDVLITAGSQMAIDLSARVLVRPGDTVAVEAIGYRSAWHALARAGARLAPIPVDAGGLDVDALARLSARRRVRAVYLTPHHQYPTTVTLTAARRLALLELARARRIAVIEDDYDHEFHYEGRPVLPLASADPAGVVLYVGTLAKILAPGLRLGYVVAPRAVLEEMAAHRTHVDRHGDQAVELAVAEMIEDGELGRHARRMRRIYRARRDHLVARVRERLGGALRFDVPPGGMALWARVAPGIAVERWAERARAGGVALATARRFTFSGRARPWVRLCFAPLTEAELDSAVDRLAAAL